MHCIAISLMICLYVRGCGYAIMAQTKEMCNCQQSICVVFFLQYLPSELYVLSKIELFISSFYFFQLGNLFDFVSYKLCFLYFSQHLSLGVFSGHSVAAVWGCPKRFSVQNNMEVVKSDGETLRSLCSILVRIWWSRSGHWKGLGEL